MEQEPLFHEDITAALGHVISALGGNKRIGHDLWPSLSPDQAGRKLATCLNGDRPENLKPDELLWILKEGRRHGVHSAMAFIAAECGYAPPLPIEPEDEAQALMREFTQSVKLQQEIAARLERLNIPVKAVR